ncbi:MAG TPA: hypothetical protein VGM86_16730 [Thermoanaerobaculia bacterium]|jgi:hypothetical protein
MSKVEDILRATVEEPEYGFTLHLEKLDGPSWDRVSVTYNPEAEVITVVINNTYTWEHPTKGPLRLVPHSGID